MNVVHYSVAINNYFVSLAPTRIVSEEGEYRASADYPHEYARTQPDYSRWKRVCGHLSDDGGSRGCYESDREDA